MIVHAHQWSANSPSAAHVNVGFGASEEGAAATKQREKDAHVPCSDMDVPTDLTSEQFDALLLERIECIMHDVAKLNALVSKAPPKVVDEYVESVQSSLTAIWNPVDDLWQSLHDESDLGPAGGSISGWLIRRQRLGQEMKGGRFSLGPRKPLNHYQAMRFDDE